MRTFSHRIWAAVSLLGLVQSASAQFIFTPNKPKVGQPVSFTYIPKGTPLANEAAVTGKLLRYGRQQYMYGTRPITIPLTKEATYYTGMLPVGKGYDSVYTTGFVLAFRSAANSALTDHNQHRLYVVPLYDVSGKPVSHALGGQAAVYTRTSFANDHGAQPDPMRSFALYEQEMAHYPENRPFYWADQLAILLKQKPSGFQAKVKAGVEAYLASNPAASVDDLKKACTFFEQIGDNERLRQCKELLLAKDTNGMPAQLKQLNLVQNTAGLAAKQAAFLAFERDFPTSSLLRKAADALVEGCLKEHDYQGLTTFVMQRPALFTNPQELDELALQVATDVKSLTLAETLSKQALSVWKKQRKPAKYMGDWETAQQLVYRQCIGTRGLILEKQGRFEEAYTATIEALDLKNIYQSDPAVNEQFVRCALKTNHPNDARLKGELFVQSGVSTPGVKTILREFYSREKGSEAGFETYWTALEAPFKKYQRDRLRAKLINLPAPNFSVRDLQGNTFTLNSLKGKIVVLDFWATWCSPCVASFPAMSKAQEANKANPKVKFLFVNSREGNADAATMARKVNAFMQRKPYSFTVPLDPGNRMSSAFGVEGIPMKFIIDQQGNIRYRSLGYEGNPTKVVDEISAIIEALSVD